MKSLLLLVGILSASQLSLMAQTSEARRQKIEEGERKEPSKEAQDRKQKSVDRVKKEGVPALDTLPVIADSKEVKVRRTEEVAQRAIAICITAVKGEGLDQETVDSLVKRYKADAFFSPKEAAFIKNPQPTEMERIQFSWRYECYVLNWLIGYMDQPWDEISTDR